MRGPVLLLALLAPLTSLASTVLPHSLEERARRSQRVAVVQVLERWTELQADGHALKTFTRVLVGQDVRGGGPRELVIVQLGGVFGPRRVQVAGDADFAVGETALVFLACARPDRCTLVGLGEGKLALDGSAVAYRELSTGRWLRRPVQDVLDELTPRPASAPPARKASRP
jgi:hypothetical protein